MIDTVFYTFILPILCFIGVLTNLISIIVFIRLKSKQQVFKWMLTNSISNLFYLFQCGFIFINKCEPFCSFSNTYWAILFKQVSLFSSGVFALFILIIEITICLQRYLTICNRRLWNLLKFKRSKVLVFLILSFIVNLPIVLSLKVRLIKNSNLANFTFSSNETKYQLEHSDFGRTTVSKMLSFLVILLRFFILLGCLIVLNILTIFKHNKLIRNKKKLLNNSFEFESKLLNFYII